MQSSTGQHGTVSATGSRDGSTSHSAARSCSKQEGSRGTVKAGNESAPSRGTATSNPFHRRHLAAGHGPRRPGHGMDEPESREHHRGRNRGERSPSSPATARGREDALHSGDCLLTSLPPPGRSRLSTKQSAHPVPAPAHRSLLRGSAQEGQLGRVLQDSSAGMGTLSPLKHLGI